MDYGVSHYRSMHHAANENYVLFKDRDGKRIKIDGKSLLFNFQNQSMIDVSYINVKTGKGCAYDAKLKDGGKYNVEWGYIEVTDKNGAQQRIKSLDFDIDGDGIADTRYKISDLQDGKVRPKKIKYNSEYIDKHLKDIFSKNNSRRRERHLEKLKRHMKEAGISEKAIAAKLGQETPKINLSTPVQTPYNTYKFKLSASVLSQISPQEVADRKNEKIKTLMQQYNDAIKKGNIEVAKLAINELAGMNLSKANKAMIEELSYGRSPLKAIVAIRLQEANNEYDKTLANTDFAKLDKTVAGMKHLRNYDRILAQYENIKADAIRKGYYKIN